MLTAKRKSKAEIDQMLSGMGVLTAPKNSKKDRPPKSKRGEQRKDQRRPSSHSVVKNPPSIAAQLDYSRNGHAHLPSLIDPHLIISLRRDVRKILKREELESYRQKVHVASGSEALASSCKSIADCQLELQELGITESLPFLQVFNSWRENDAIRKLAYGLGETAATMLDLPSVRLYQDSLFWKRQNDGPTPWHVDARMAPFDTSFMITFWLPLNPVPADGTALQFCSKTHADFALPYWNPLSTEYDPESEWTRLETRYPQKPVHYMPMSVGDATVHSGWTLHCSNGNEDGDRDRTALAITFVDSNAQIRPGVLDNGDKGDNEDVKSYKDWVSSVPPRKKFHHEHVPIVWPAKKGGRLDL